jgi:hypothetical protein
MKVVNFHGIIEICSTHEGVSKSFRAGRLERKLQMIQLSATRRSYIAILWVSLVSFSATTLCVGTQRLFVVVVVVVVVCLFVYFVIGSVRKLLDTPSYIVNLVHALLILLSYLMNKSTTNPADRRRTRCRNCGVALYTESCTSGGRIEFGLGGYMCEPEALGTRQYGTWH